MTCPCQNDSFEELTEGTAVLDRLLEAARRRPELVGAVTDAARPTDYWRLPDGRWILVYGRDSGDLAVLLKETPNEAHVIGIVHVDANQGLSQAVTEVLFSTA